MPRGAGPGRVVAVLTLSGAVFVGCSESDPLVLPPRSEPATTQTSEAPVPASPTSVAGGTTPAPVAREWIAATANLAGLPSECGNMSHVSARPDRDMLIAGIALRGLWASTNGSDEWVELGTGQGSAEIVNRTSAIVYDPEHPDTFWQSGTYNGGGAYRTTDNGATFTQLGDVTHSDLISVDFSDPERQTLLSGTHELINVFRSTDGGNTWSDVSGGLPPGIGMAASPHVVDAETHLLGTKDGTEPGVFRTTDGGVSWTRVFDGGVLGRPLVAQSDGAIYWPVEGGGALITSNDGGATWTRVPGRISPGATGIIELPDGRLASLGENHVIVSADKGTTWQATGAPFPYSPMGLTYSPFRKAFYIWYFTCEFENDNPIPLDAIMRLDFDYETE